MAPQITMARALSLIVSFLALQNNMFHEIFALESNIRANQFRLHHLRRRRRLMMASAIILHATGSPVRRHWRLPKGQWYETILPELPDDMFRVHFRMHRETFNNLVSEIGKKLERQYVVRAPIPSHKRIAASLFRICSSCELRTVAELFGVGVSTIHQLVDEFTKVIIDEYFDKVLTFPNPQEMHFIAEGFEKMCGFPMTIGAIDGCHIPISPPKAKAVDYYNFKGWYSTILFALVDDKYCFRYISVGHPGRNHDAFIYANSALKSVVDQGLLNHQNITLDGVEVNYVFLGDSAFPLSRNIMKPYPQKGQLTPQQALFNRTLSSGRRVVENAFGRLKARFRIIGRRIEVKSLSRAKKLIKACVVLHNLLEQRKDPVDQTWVLHDDATVIQQPDRVTKKKNDIGVAVREAIANHLFTKM